MHKSMKWGVSVPTNIVYGDGTKANGHTVARPSIGTKAHALAYAETAGMIPGAVVRVATLR